MLLLEKIEKREESLKNIDKRLINLENKANEARRLEKKIYDDLEKIDGEVKSIAIKVEQENEMNNSVLMSFLKLVLQFGLIAATFYSWYVGTMAYLKINIYHSMWGLGVGLFVISGNLFLAFYIIVKLVQDIVCDLCINIRAILKKKEKKKDNISCIKSNLVVQRVIAIFFLFHSIIIFCIIFKII